MLAVPDLPIGKVLLNVVLSNDVDNLFRVIFEDVIFFHRVTSQTEDKLRNFSVTPWREEKSRKMTYQFSKRILLSNYLISVNQVTLPPVITFIIPNDPGLLLS
jgi:hypothetical protein